MGFIIQLQRRAIEKFNDYPKTPWPETIFGKDDVSFFLTNGKIFCYGVSKGFGTCSDIHGMDVAVFGFIKPNKSTIPKNDVRPAELKKCSYAVYLWPYGVVPVKSKEKIDPNQHDPEEPERVVELLNYVDHEYCHCSLKNGEINWIQVKLERTGLISTYIQM
ncbi:hypothetical protein MYX06_03295 [Patescibacteria group bacterium AH-259-L05]|nr:hypothetical protein [Patescibacteria group bacterium AH-259-L05]